MLNLFNLMFEDKMSLYTVIQVILLNKKIYIHRPIIEAIFQFSFIPFKFYIFTLVFCNTLPS